MNRLTFDKMARVRPVGFTMEYAITFDSIIRGHHVYKDTWNPIKGQCIDCRPDTREEAKEYDTNSLGLYEHHTLVGHVPVEISCLLTHFLKADKENSLSAIVIGGRKKERGLVIPAKNQTDENSKNLANVLSRKNGRFSLIATQPCDEERHSEDTISHYSS